jgi:hypothetical protein
MSIAREKIVASVKSDVFQFLWTNYGDAVAVEMEGFGFLDAARASQRVSALVIRGISDLINNKAKADSEGYQEIASRHASAFAFELLAKLKIQSSYQTASSAIPAEAQVVQPSSSNLPAPGPATKASPQPGEVKVFFSYAHEDEELRDKLATHLSTLRRQGIIEEWHDRQIGAGQEWAGEIDCNLEAAHVILLLVSADFIGSDYCMDKELSRAMERHEMGEARVIPVILRPVDLEGLPFSKLQALPTDCKPITLWSDQDEAFLNVARGIRSVVQSIAVSP